MANNNGLDALIGLGILGAMMNSDPVKGAGVDASKRHFNEKCGKKTTLADGANATKELYNAYISVGFNETQAFELLKLVLSK